MQVILNTVKLHGHALVSSWPALFDSDSQIRGPMLLSMVIL